MSTICWAEILIKRCGKPFLQQFHDMEVNCGTFERGLGLHDFEQGNLQWKGLARGLGAGSLRLVKTVYFVQPTR